MKVKFWIFAILLFTFAFALPINAQQTTDQRIENVEQEIEKLKKLKLAALEKERDELKRDLQNVRGDTGVPSDSVRPAESVTPSSMDTASRPTSAQQPNFINTKFDKVAPALPLPVTGTGAQDGLSVETAVPTVTPPSQVATPQTATNSVCLDAILQDGKVDRATAEMCNIARSVVQQRFNRREPDRGMFVTSSNQAILNIVAQKLAVSFGATGGQFDKAVRTFLLGAEQSRTDKQAGADSKSSGTTSLAVKGGVPAFLAWAQENGGAEGARDGNSVTFRVNPVGLADALANWGGSNGFLRPSEVKGLDSFFHKDDTFTRVLKNTAVGFTFDITRGTDPPTLIGSKQQLSAVSFRYQFLNRRDPRHSRYKTHWADYLVVQQKFTDDLATTVLPNLLVISTTAANSYQNADLNAWFQAANNAIKASRSENLTAMDEASAIEALRAVLEQEVAKLPIEKLKKDTTFVTNLNSFARGFVTLEEKFSEVMKEVAKGEVVTFEYTNYREVNAPDLSNFRFIVSKGFWDGADLTFNGSLTMFNKKPTSTDPAAKIQRIRDFDFTGQVDIPFTSFIKRANEELADPNSDGRPPVLGIPVLTFAGKYQRLQSDAVLPDGAVKTGTKGDLAFGQLKLTIPINFSGLSFKLPFSFTLANRSDLIKEKEVRGNFGFTLDIDPFFSKLKGMLVGGLGSQ